MCTLDSNCVSCFFLSCVYYGWYGNKHFVNSSDWLRCLIHVRSQVFEKKCALQLTQKRLTDNEFQQVGKSERNFWWKWLHGQEHNQAQQKAGEAAFARAQHAEVPSANRFGVLASVFDEVYSSQQFSSKGKQVAWQGVTCVALVINVVTCATFCHGICWDPIQGTGTVKPPPVLPLPGVNISSADHFWSIASLYECLHNDCSGFMNKHMATKTC